MEVRERGKRVCEYDGVTKLSFALAGLATIQAGGSQCAGRPTKTLAGRTI